MLRVGVTDSVGNPLPGVTVGVSGSSTGNSAVTDGTGTATMTVFAAESLEMEVSYSSGPLRFRTLLHQVYALEDRTLTVALGQAGAVTDLYRPASPPAVDAAPVAVGTTSTATIGRQAVSSTSLRIRWTAPTRTGGSRIVGYRLTISPGGRVLNVPASARSVVVRALPPGIAHRFTVQAVNAVGPSPITRSGTFLTGDRTGPTTTAKLPAATRTASSLATLRGSDRSSIRSFQVLIARGPAAGRLGRWTVVPAWRALKVTRVAVPVARGTRVCLLARATDVMGNVGRWSRPACVVRR